MLSDMVWPGLFHRHIMTSGGRTATPARTVQPDNVFTLPAMPAVHTAETQTVATVALIESSCIWKVYGPALHGAVPKCTGPHACPSVGSRKTMRPTCAIGNSAEQVHPVQSV